jgi:imidazolonepropionase-like amidohydrolase
VSLLRLLHPDRARRAPILALSLIASACGRSASDRASLASTAPLAITHVTLIDVTSGTPRADMTVLSAAGHITALGSGDSVSVPSGARVLDGRGKYLIPGLWDMHVHSGFDRYERGIVLPSFIANGITGVRDMAGDCFTDCADQDTAYNPDHGASAVLLHGWEREIAAGAILGPRMIVGSAMLDGPRPKWPGGVAIHDTAEARAAVRRAKERGADFIKVYSGLSLENFLAIADEAKHRGLPFAGHVPNVVSLEDAANAGQTSMEHLLKMQAACSNRRREVEALIVRQATHPAHSPADFADQVRARTRALNESFSVEACASLLQRFVRDSTWQVPTLTVLRGGVAFAWDSAFRGDPRQQYMAKQDTSWWQTSARRLASLATPADIAAAQLSFHHYVQIVGAMHRAGVRLMAGTDVSNPWVYWGSSLHDELAMFVDAGLTPLEALRTATIEPARFLHASDTLGTIEPGKVADMVLLDADPLADIHNTQRIRAIVVRGQVVDSAARQRLFDQARQAARTF